MKLLLPGASPNQLAYKGPTWLSLTARPSIATGRLRCINDAQGSTATVGSGIETGSRSSALGTYRLLSSKVESADPSSGCRGWPGIFDLLIFQIRRERSFLRKFETFWGACRQRPKQAPNLCYWICYYATGFFKPFIFMININHRKSLIYIGILGWLMGLEPTTTGITILDSTN
jgi:hypothetical protein